MNQKTASQTFDRYLRSNMPLVFLLSHEEARVMRAMVPILRARKKRLVEWSFTSGLVGEDLTAATTKDPAQAMAAILQYAPKHPGTVFLMKDLHGFVGWAGRNQSPVLVRYLRDVVALFEGCSCSMVCLSPTFDIPPDLSKSAAVMTWPLPTGEELEAVLRDAQENTDLPVKLDTEARGQVVDAIRGLSEFEARCALASAMVACRELSERVVPLIVHEKAQIICSGGLLEYYDKTVTMDQVGGLAELKKYINRKMAVMTPAARSRGLDAPKGLILVGVPGTGKSLAAKAIAGGRLPLARLDVGALMGGLVGQSEANTRSALAQVEAIAPVVLWIDEMEKALAVGGSENDGGTRIRVFGSILTWMAERTSDVYVVATANNIAALAPELISRFDAVFFVDLPSKSERLQIAKVHLNRRKIDADAYDLDEFAGLTHGFAGREIERAVVNAIETAFVEDRPLIEPDLAASALAIKPVSVTMSAQIEAIRDWVRISDASRAGEGLDARPVELKPRRVLDVT